MNLSDALKNGSFCNNLKRESYIKGLSTPPIFLFSKWPLARLPYPQSAPGRLIGLLRYIYMEMFPIFQSYRIYITPTQNSFLLHIAINPIITMSDCYQTYKQSATFHDTLDCKLCQRSALHINFHSTYCCYSQERGGELSLNLSRHATEAISRIKSTYFL